MAMDDRYSYIANLPGAEDNLPGAKDFGKPLIDTLRPVLLRFAVDMELKLRANDHKTDWRTLPIEALFRRFMLEVEEFKVADEFLKVEEACKELVDIANFALILWDRLSMLDQSKSRGEQK